MAGPEDNKATPSNREHTMDDKARERDIKDMCVAMTANLAAHHGIRCKQVLQLGHPRMRVARASLVQGASGGSEDLLGNWTVHGNTPSHRRCRRGSDPMERRRLRCVAMARHGIPARRLALLRRRVGHGLRRHLVASRHTVLISSTSVYPAEPNRYRESDVVRRVSPHSGACLLDIEGKFDPATTTILRAGGLFGPGRHPRGFLRGRPLTNPEDTVNMVHQQDVVRAILHAAEQRLAGPFNVVSPIRTSRSTFYAAAGATPHALQEQGLPQGRHILSEALLETGFTFLHPDPAKAVLSLT